MEANYCVYGLSVRSSFSLAGMSEWGRPEDAVVELDRVGAEELGLAWSGSASQTSWRGTLRDGAELKIEWGGSGDLLFSYGDRARFHLDAAGRRLRCAVAKPEALGWMRVLLTRVLALVALARGFEALHAGAVETAAGVVAIVAPSGAGKSTLAAELVRRGHRLFADDVLVLESTAGRVRAHPASPHLSLADGTTVAGTALGDLGGKRWIAVAAAASAPCEVAAVAILERGRGERPKALEEPASPLALAPYMLGLPDDEGRDAERFRVYSDLVEDARLFRLTAAADDSPAAIAAELEAVLGLPAPTLAGLPA